MHFLIAILALCFFIVLVWIYSYVYTYVIRIFVPGFPAITFLQSFAITLVLGLISGKGIKINATS